MSLITDIDYGLQAVRLSALRYSDDPVLTRLITLDSSFAANPYIQASGLADIDRWPEITRALDSPPPDYASDTEDENGAGPGPSTRAHAGTRDRRAGAGGVGGLKYTQTIMGNKSGGIGMRVNGRRTTQGDAPGLSGGDPGGDGKRARIPYGGAREKRANSGSAINKAKGTRSPPLDQMPLPSRPLRPSAVDGFFSPSARPRSDSAPAPVFSAGIQPMSLAMESAMLKSGRGLGGGGVKADLGVLEQTLGASLNDTSAYLTGEGETDHDLEATTLSQSPSRSQAPSQTDPDHMGRSISGFDGDESSMGIGESARPSEFGLGLTAGGGTAPLGETLLDGGSDMDDEEMHDAEDGYNAEEEGGEQGEGGGGGEGDDTAPTGGGNRQSHHESRRSSRYHHHEDPLELGRVDIPPLPSSQPAVSSLTMMLNKHIPHLVSTSVDPAEDAVTNPFTSLYASVAAPPGNPSVSLKLYFPHSADPSKPLAIQVRKDATTEEVTGYGLLRYWEEGREPKLREEQDEAKLSSVGWGLRIVEDDGEVDEDFPPLDRDGLISRFAYPEFAVVFANESQTRQNIAKAPQIIRRPSRVIANPTGRIKLSEQGRPSFNTQPSTSSITSFSSNEAGPISGSVSAALKGSVGLSSALSKTALLRVRVAAGVDVRFTTTISVPSDMYIADLTEVLVKKKRLPNPATDWVLCLGDLSLALPLDRTVASLEGNTDLALVRKQWALERGLRIGDRRGGDPSASIFKRVSEPLAAAKFGDGLRDFSQTYKKYTVQRKIAIGRHERVVAIDGEYIHIMPSESRAFFDSTKTTSFHISLVANVKQTGRTGGFKINIWREGSLKRYEFEAESNIQAKEIVDTIKTLLKQYTAERAAAGGSRALRR